MIKRNLLLDPCWSAKDLGQALPDSPHAVSVALPRWQDVIAYEEKEPACIDALQAIYPRFGLNPLVSEIAKQALIVNGLEESTAWPYPNFSAAKKAQAHCHRMSKDSITNITDILGLKCLIANSEASPYAKAFWQHTGLGASSRQAAIALKKEHAPSSYQGDLARTTLCERLAQIYSCRSDFIGLHPSGMAALTAALEAIRSFRSEGCFLQLGFPYVDVLKLPQVIFQGCELLLETDPTKLGKELDIRKPAAVIVELPSNPMLQCVDLPAISKLAHERGIPVIADDTIGSALNIDALPYADLIFSSLTKSFAGRGDILSGALVINPVSVWGRELHKAISNCPPTKLSDADAIALEQVSRDVNERIPKLNEACMTLKTHLENHPSVLRVLHPEKCPNFQAIMRPKGGFGCLLSFELIGGAIQARKFYDALKVCKGPSLGTNFTLVCPYVLLAHYKELDWASKCGVPSHLLRVSVGLEKPEELWMRFNNALSA